LDLLAAGREARTRAASATTFMAMWLAMMLPATVPMLSRYHGARYARGDDRAGVGTAVMACAASPRHGKAAGGAWRLGLNVGASCMGCCSALMLIQLVLGAMDLTVMAIVAAVIALERLLPRPEPIVRMTGMFAVVTGTVLIGRALVSH
jgi:predicted metal-binding membrane protein